MLENVSHIDQKGFRFGDTLLNVSINGILFKEEGGDLCESVCNVGSSWVKGRHERLFSNFSESIRDSMLLKIEKVKESTNQMQENVFFKEAVYYYEKISAKMIKKTRSAARKTTNFI